MLMQRFFTHVFVAFYEHRPHRKLKQPDFLEQLSLTNERTRAEHDKGLTPTQQQHEQCHLPINAIDKFSFSVTQDCLDP